MTDGRVSLVDLLIAGLTAPKAAADESLRQRILRELEDRLPAEGDGAPTVTRALGPIESYRDTVRALGRAPSGRFEYADAICALIAVGAVPADEADDLAPFLPAWSGFRRQLVLNRIAAGDLDGARSLAAGLDDEHRWRAYRDIGAELAARGDAPGFSPNGVTTRSHVIVTTSPNSRNCWSLPVARTVGPARARTWSKASSACSTGTRQGWCPSSIS
ncbi:hypothetical protein IU510_23055 [Nocardia cyriacigeorgica]|uniref:hypothetical protein n=1 Tax=Nocardia cyriacigeorgica TaxID=135487 RepID=UPI0018946EC5|nr:hypothetical protein [Nocardia cyriacigeorgica]MBF6100929.1 hypothetical protein [Nocardia cyriacigeorgica]